MATELATEVATAPATTEATVVWRADTKDLFIPGRGEVVLEVLAARRGRGVVEGDVVATAVVMFVDVVATAVAMFVVGGGGGGVLEEEMGRTARGLDALQSRTVVDAAAAPDPPAPEAR